jgi:hypothetical protein
MPQLQIGDPVQVDLSGLQAPGVQIGAGVSGSGTVTSIDSRRRVYIVTLSVSIGGKNTIEIPFDDVS